MRMWQTLRTQSVGRHVHAQAYVSILLSGSYEEAGDLGRFFLDPGDVVFHDRFEAHVDRFTFTGARVLNLPIRDYQSAWVGVGRVSDLNCVIRLAEGSSHDALEAVIHLAQPHCREARDWPEELALELLRNPSLCLGAWCQRRSLAPWSVSRGFSQVFSVSPEAYRARAKARKAWKACQQSSDRLADVAVRCGFADQSHMTRQVKELTGRTPHAWRSFGMTPRSRTSA